MPSEGDARRGGCMVQVPQPVPTPRARVVTVGTRACWQHLTSTASGDPVLGVLRVFSRWVAKPGRAGDTGWHSPGLVHRAGMGAVPGRMGAVPGMMGAISGVMGAIPGMMGAISGMLPWLLHSPGISSPAAQAAAAQVVLRKVLPAQGSSFPPFAVEHVRNKLRKPLALVSPSPQAAGQQCPRVLPA